MKAKALGKQKLNPIDPEASPCQPELFRLFFGKKLSQDQSISGFLHQKPQYVAVDRGNHPTNGVYIERQGSGRVMGIIGCCPCLSFKGRPK
ncbi:hypothetical protein SynBIOSU31_00414 [Synechococcus sp. BIOS-U3-1]|nr:hypothetical protein SynBIOSU31_00414 [Synechococcus sp. BIOS-U3-1]